MRTLSVFSVFSVFSASSVSCASARAFSVALCFVCASCAGSGEVVPTVVVNVDGAASVEANGATFVDLSAVVFPKDAVVAFASTSGLLSASNVRAENGRAHVRVLAPFEQELPGGDVHATVTATVQAGEVIVVDSASIDFTVPTSGAPLLFVSAAPDRVVAGSGDAITLSIRGTRLPTSTVTLTPDVAGVVALPATVELVDGTGSIAVIAPDVAGSVVVTVSAVSETGQGVSEDVELVFVADGEAVFDLNGDFIQVAHGVTDISDFFLLDGDHQCAIATSISLAHITQNGAHVEVTNEACTITMPSVKLVFMGTITPTVGAPFIQAANDAGAGKVLAFDLPSQGANAAFSPPAQAQSPLVVGVVLDDEASDAIPTDSADERVVDADDDGHPGVTVNAGGERYTAYRSRTTTMTGTIRSSNSIDGALINETETVVYDDPLGSGGPAMTPKSSPFRFERLDGQHGGADYRGRDGDPSSVSCADVQAWVNEQMAAAFPQPSPDVACQ